MFARLTPSSLAVVTGRRLATNRQHESSSRPPAARFSFATFCHKGRNTAQSLATVRDDGERLAEENNGKRRCAPIISGLEGRCSIHLSYGRAPREAAAAVHRSIRLP